MNNSSPHNRIANLAIQTKKKFVDIWNNIKDDSQDIMEIDDIQLQPSLFNAKQFKLFNALENKYQYFIQPLDTWLSLNDL